MLLSVGLGAFQHFEILKCGFPYMKDSFRIIQVQTNKAFNAILMLT